MKLIFEILMFDYDVKGSHHVHTNEAAWKIIGQSKIWKLNLFR